MKVTDVHYFCINFALYYVRLTNVSILLINKKQQMDDYHPENNSF